MSNLIQFLQSAGRDPRGMAAMGLSYEDVVAGLDIEDAQKRALIARDAVRLNELLGGRPVMYCSQYTPGPGPKPPRRDLPTPDTVPQHEETPEENPDEDEAKDQRPSGESDQ